ncbi:MAG: hypothetical protein RLZZ385_2509 [Pseudomonadota bacterium]
MTAPVPVITIDGPSGSGKGTIAARIAKNLGYHLLDSGALYRVLGCVVRDRGIDINDHQAVAATARALDIRFGTGAGGSVSVDGKDYTDIIRQESGGEMASLVGAIPAAREALFDRQLAFRRPPGLVADGRDMGTVVFPDARLKIFLTASPEERAHRRHKQLIAKGIGAILPDLLHELKERDARDSRRAVSPLRPAADAIVLDTTDMSIDSVVDRVMELIGNT